jgi:hypothetical protein
MRPAAAARVAAAVISSESFRDGPSVVPLTMSGARVRSALHVGAGEPAPPALHLHAHAPGVPPGNCYVSLLQRHHHRMATTDCCWLLAAWRSI